LEHAFLTLKHLAYAQEIDIFYTQLGSAMEARVQHALQIIAASDYSKAAQLESRQLIPFHMNYSIIISCINCWSYAATAVSHVDNGPVHRITSNCFIKSLSNYTTFIGSQCFQFNTEQNRLRIHDTILTREKESLN